MLVRNLCCCAGANPLHAAGSRRIRRELDGLTVDSGMSAVTVFDVDDAIGNRYQSNVFALDVCSSN